MRLAILSGVALAASLVCGTAMAQIKDAPASPSGAPAAAAEHGSSEAGVDGSKNEMAAHKDNEKAQNKMDDPHKQ